MVTKTAKLYTSKIGKLDNQFRGYFGTATSIKAGLELINKGRLAHRPNPQSLLGPANNPNYGLQSAYLIWAKEMAADKQASIIWDQEKIGTAWWKSYGLKVYSDSQGFIHRHGLRKNGYYFSYHQDIRVIMVDHTIKVTWKGKEITQA